ncbi:uncharacterized protein LOC114528843 [Dendronephthya gigantea]|uniref:uncharacterized protein LOC114528843 n=1 Tax=Dendronephthya gigantea TaxID=151771 RepID=UPI00106B2A3B|nr:uncharacterized protein LOC114528843 [Dendronephthya gigantea]
MCNWKNIKQNNLSSFSDKTVAAVSIFWADGFLCLLFVLLTHFKYTRITVLNYSVCTIATSNTQWIWFFIFTALSSVMNGLYFFFLHEKKRKEFPVITAWLANLLSIMSLLFAVKYQWKQREEAYNNMTNTNGASTTSTDETSPILFQQNGTSAIQNPSKTDVFFVLLFLLSAGFFIAAWTKETEIFYWVAHILLWIIQAAIFIIILIIHYKITHEGPSVFVKCILLAAVMANAVTDIPSYIWLNCILEDENPAEDAFKCYDILIGLVLLSHIAFFFVMRTEFLRLKDVARWRVAGEIDNLDP